jgi:hypothetical protein
VRTGPRRINRAWRFRQTCLFRHTRTTIFNERNNAVATLPQGSTDSDHKEFYVIFRDFSQSDIELDTRKVIADHHIHINISYIELGTRKVIESDITPPATFCTG